MIATVEAMCRRLQNTYGFGLPEIPGLQRKGSRVHQPPPPMPAEPSHPSSSLQDGGGIGSEGRFRLWQGGYLALPLACALLPQCGVPGKLAHP